MRAVLAAVLLCLCAPALAESGIASVYWEGTRTANGERLCTRCLTAAHRTLPFGTLVRVCRARAAISCCIVVRINDRGPAAWTHRIIDLTPAAARALGFSDPAHVTIEPLGGGQPKRGGF